MRRERDLWLFRYADGCNFAVMEREACPSEPAAWFEEFGSATRVRAAREAGVIVELITAHEWDTKHRPTFGVVCKHPHPKLPTSGSGDIEDDLNQHAIDHAVQSEMTRLRGQIAEQIADATSALGKSIATVIDRLRPDLSPYDARAAVEAIVKELQRAVDNA